MVQTTVCFARYSYSTIRKHLLLVNKKGADGKHGASNLQTDHNLLTPSSVPASKCSYNMFLVKKLDL